MIEDGYSLCQNKWALNKEIKNELPLLLIISCLTAKTGYCMAKNKYFSELFSEHETCISRKIKKLEEKGYITIEYIKRGCEIKDRKIRLAKIITDDYQNCQPTISKIAKDNNIEDNNIKEIYKESFEKFWKEFPKERIGNKDKAYSAWKRAIKEKRTTEEEIIDAAKQYSHSEEVKRGYAKGCQAWINDDRFKVQYKKEDQTKEEKTIKIVSGEFYLDNTMPDYKDVTVGMTDDQCEKLWKWIYDKYMGQEINQSTIKDIIRKYNKNNLR